MKNLNETLLYAVYSQKRQRIMKLLQKGANINWSDEDGRTILMHAILSDNASCEIVELLVKNGADVNAREMNRGWTALHFAVREGHVDIVEFLIEKGVVLDAQDTFGNTPLIEAIHSFKGDPSIINLLLRHGANKNAANIEAISPISLARTIGDSTVIKILMENAENK